MSVLRFFGENLRLLCKTRPSIASVCRDLDINRLQFNRNMSGHYFPKPNVLQQICDYFLVELRIYLEPLSPDDLERVRRGQSQSVFQAQPGYLSQAIDYLNAAQLLLFHKVSFQMVSIAFGVDRFPNWKLRAVI